jgi:hypothetical protein
VAGCGGFIAAALFVSNPDGESDQWSDLEGQTPRIGTGDRWIRRSEEQVGLECRERQT